MDLLAKVGAPTGKALRGPEVANAVLITAADGYQVVVGLAEADPNIRANRMILANQADAPSLLTRPPPSIKQQGEEQKKPDQNNDVRELVMPRNETIYLF